MAERHDISCRGMFAWEFCELSNNSQSQTTPEITYYGTAKGLDDNALAHLKAVPDYVAALGEAGWDLVPPVVRDEDGGVRYLFKRAKRAVKWEYAVVSGDQIPPKRFYIYVFRDYQETLISRLNRGGPDYKARLNKRDVIEFDAAYVQQVLMDIMGADAWEYVSGDAFGVIFRRPYL